MPLERCSSWGTSKQHMKLQQPRNYDFRVSQFDPPRSQSGNDRETTTSPAGHHWEANVALSTTAKLQQLRDKQPWNDDFCRIVQRPRNATTMKWQVRNCTIAGKYASDFAVSLWLLSFQVPFGSLWLEVICFPWWSRGSEHYGVTVFGHFRIPGAFCRRMGAHVVLCLCTTWEALHDRHTQHFVNIRHWTQWKCGHHPCLGSEKKHIKKKTRKQNFHRIVPGFLGGFCLLCFSPP